MTAQEFINKIKPLLSGLAVKEDDSTILSYLNMAKDEIARDTMLWTDGEEITLLSDTTEYTLGLTPIQILDVYDENYDIITRGKYTTYGKGYFQLSPNKIQITYVPVAGTKIYVNYYYTPEDYKLGDNIDIPPALHKATRHMIISESLNMFRGEKEIMNAKNHLGIYNAQIEKFLAQTDTLSTETLVNVDLIKQKGLV